MEHLLPQSVEYVLLFGVALLWTVTYLLIIRQGYRDKSCGMPMPAICCNISWEFMMTFIMPFHPLQQLVTFIWFLLDCIILFQYFHITKINYSKQLVYTSVFSLIIIALLLQVTMAVEFHDTRSLYSAFGINVLMSILFIRMLLMKGLSGQSLWIAYLKMAGTVCASLAFYSVYPQSVLLTIMYILIFLLDLTYIGLAYYNSVKVIHKSSVNKVM